MRYIIKITWQDGCIRFGAADLIPTSDYKLAKTYNTYDANKKKEQWEQLVSRVATVEIVSSVYNMVSYIEALNDI